MNKINERGKKRPYLLFDLLPRICKLIPASVHTNQSFFVINSTTELWFWLADGIFSGGSIVWGKVHHERKR